MKCRICGILVKNNNALGQHIRTHNMLSKEYYDKYILKYDESKCMMCGADTTYINFSKGYSKFCSGSCSTKFRKIKSQIIYDNENNISNRPKCYCGTTVRYNGPSKGYSEYCSIKCSRNSTKTQLKREKTCIEKYGVSNAINNENVKKRFWSKIHRAHFKKRILGFTHVSPNFSIDEFDGQRQKENKKFEWSCAKCNNIFEDKLHSGHIPSCPICFPKLGWGKKSNLEKELVKWVETKIKIVKNYRHYYNHPKYYELDIFIPSKNIGIEFDGLYWHSELAGKDKSYHINKNRAFKEIGIDVIHVFENEWLQKQDIVKSIISSRLGLLENRIFARKCVFMSISPVEYRTFLEKNHIHGPINSKYKYGLFYNGKLVSVIGFGKSRFSNENELHRYCNKINTSIVGGFSKLLKHSGFTGSTFCDLRYFDGNGYKCVGFNRIKNTGPNYWYFNNRFEIHNRMNFQKHKLVNKLKDVDNNKTEWQNMKDNGWNRIWDCGNIKMELV